MLSPLFGLTPPMSAAPAPQGNNTLVSLPERILMVPGSTPTQQLIAMDVIEAKRLGTPRAISLLEDIASEDTNRLPPLRKLDKDMLRQESVQALRALAKNQSMGTGPLAQQALERSAQRVLSRDKDDVRLKAEMVYSIQVLGASEGNAKELQQMMSKVLENAEIRALVRSYALTELQGLNTLA